MSFNVRCWCRTLLTNQRQPPKDQTGQGENGKHLTPYRREQNFPELRVTEQRERGRAVPVEVRRLFEERHKTVDPCELDEGINRAVAEPGCERAELEAYPDLRTEPRAPAIFIVAEPRFAELVARERRAEHVGGDLPANQAVVDTAARRRLHEPRGVADREQAARVR